MKISTRVGLYRLFSGIALAAMSLPAITFPAFAQAPAGKPNILFIMGDDIGWMRPRIYHRGLMVGETPNIDRIGQEGAIFMDYLAMRVHLWAQRLLHRDVPTAHRYDSSATARQPVIPAARHAGRGQVPDRPRL